MAADETITVLHPTSASQAQYELGRLNWASPAENHQGWVPDLVGGSGKPVRLTENQLIDVVLLGDGYHDKTDFEKELATWLGNFFKVDVYSRFRGAFRIRALFTQSAGPCRMKGTSYYGVQVDDNGDVLQEPRGKPRWWDDAVGAETFRGLLFDVVETFHVNHSRYQADLDIGDKPMIHNKLAGLRSHLVVMMLVKSVDSSGNPAGSASGFTRDVRYRDSKDIKVNVGIGDSSLHEFGHAFAYLEDEYIGKRDPGVAPSLAAASRAAVQRSRTARSIFDLSNLSFDNRLGTAPPWLHLSPWGTLRRQAAGTDPSPVVGWLWRGGEQDRGVWHSEYKCLMNGRSQNYTYPVRVDGPTANLRSTHRYCLWCQEIVVTRILEKTGQLARAGDPTQINELGRFWHTRWVSDFRKKYWDYFDLDTQLRDREADYASQHVVDDTTVPVWRSDLYEVFQADPATRGSTATSSDDEELSMEELLMIVG